MHCEVAEAHPEKRPKEAPGAPGPCGGPSGLNAHMAFRVTVSGGGCGDGDPRDLLSRLPAPQPRAHDLLRPRSPRDYGPSKVAAAGKGKSVWLCQRTRPRCGEFGLPGVAKARLRRNRPENLVELSPEITSFSPVVWD